MRGVLTEKIKDQSRFHLGVEITRAELRLMPYVQHVMMNEQRIDPIRVNEEERAIPGKWRKRGWIDGGASGLVVTHQFWHAMSEILWLGYVDIK